MPGSCERTSQVEQRFGIMQFGISLPLKAFLKLLFISFALIHDCKSAFHLVSIQYLAYFYLHSLNKVLFNSLLATIKVA